MNSVKLTGCCDSSIEASKMVNGQVAVIVKSTQAPAYVGRIVCRHNFAGTDHLTVVGHPTYFSGASGLTGDKCRVRVLKAGEQITVC